MRKTSWNQVSTTKNIQSSKLNGRKLSENFKANSLDSLANSSQNSESLSDESAHESDSGTDLKLKNSFQVKCEVYSQNVCGSIRSWTKSDGSNSESSYDYLSAEYIETEKKACQNEKRCMETISEETSPETDTEPKVSVKEILARFENLKEEKDSVPCFEKKDKNNNNVSSGKVYEDLNRIKNVKNSLVESNVTSTKHNKEKELNKYKELKVSKVKSSQKETTNTKIPSIIGITEKLITKSKKETSNSKKEHTKESIASSTSASKGQINVSSLVNGHGSSSNGKTHASGSNLNNSKRASSCEELQAKAAQNRSRSPTNERLEVISNNLQNKSHKDVSPSRRISRDGSRDGATSPSSPLPSTGKYSLMQFAMQNFRQMADLEHQRMDQQKPKHKTKEWTWKQQTDVIKWQGTPIDGPLLRLEDPELTPLSIECFDCILRYCGDQPLTPDMSEVKCVYTVLMHCHKYAPLRDEVYCQLMKQTTSNKSENPESCQRAWRLLSIVAAYFACSDHLLPYLMEHLTSAANDRRRVCHGTAAVCLSNLRKTQKCGGRKNVPSVEEVTAVSAGRSARRQIYRLPGGAERVVNTRCSTVVADVIQELCGLIGVNNEAEQQEFSLYCIVQGDAFTMPLAADEYILDVTTELHKAAQPFYLIFCRSVWYHPLKHDSSPLYTEVLFNQVAPDYLEGLLLRLGNPNLPPSVVRDMALIAALLHRAADLGHAPSLKEVKFLLPKPVLGLREPRPPQWLALVQTSWGQAVGLSVSRAKHRVLQVLSSWPLFGSSFFAVKRVVGDPEHWTEHILALNRGGVHFLDMNTHETLQHWPFAEVISTRKVRSEDGALFLDMKCGNLLQQRVTRLQTEQAHEISRLVRQYINLEQEYSNRNK